MAASSQLREILSRAGLATLLTNFEQENIVPAIIDKLTDQDLARLGVTTIGERIKLRESAKQHSQQVIESSDSHTSRTTSGPSFTFRNSLFSRQTGRQSSPRSKTQPGWTGHFVCLSNTEQTRVPNCSEKEILLKAGLGHKTIRLNNNAGEEDVICALMSSETTATNEVKGFPSLKEAGGIELLRSVQNCRNLTLIEGPWTSQLLKQRVGSQARIYIRPIQKSLSTVPIKEDVVETAKSVCNLCGGRFSLCELRAHIEECKLLVLDLPDLPDLPEFDISGLSDDMGTSNDVHDERSEQFQGQELIETALSTPSNSSTNSSHIVIEEINVDEIVKLCAEMNNPVEILRLLQRDIVQGRLLDVEDGAEALVGETTFIAVDRENMLETGFDEIRSLPTAELRKTLQVQFYNENAEDVGGPRKEFFRLILKEVKGKYFDNGLRELLAQDYIIVGIIFALSILQNGKMPTFISPFLEEIFDEHDHHHESLMKLREGLNKLRLYDIFRRLPVLQYLLHDSPASILTVSKVLTLLKPMFAETGSNNFTFEKSVYSHFIKYLREAAAGRRGNVSPGHVLMFVTGTDEEPILGFNIHPAIHFSEVSGGNFMPTASTCINVLNLPRPSIGTALLLEEKLFELYDLAFCNSYFGLR